MKRVLGYLWLPLLLLLGQLRLAGQVEMSLISDSLLSNSSAIVIEHTETLEIHNKSLIKRKVSSSTLVTKDNGPSSHVIYIPYDKYSKIEDLEISILSVDGKKKKSISRKDMIDQSAVNNVTIASDTRFLIYSVIEKEMPFIVKLNYSKISKETFTIDRYTPVSHANTAILSSVFEVVNYDINNVLRFSNHPWAEPKTELTNKFRKYTFQLKNITSIYLKNLDDKNIPTSITPILEDFQMDGVDGNLSSWGNFGLWFATLGDGTDIFDEKSTLEIKSVIGDTKDKRVIVEKLYKYLQENMRYVSIQLGIGGFKPMAAQDVHNNKYGDCKALSNYMKAILKVVDIPSNYIIISAGSKYNNPNPNFPQNVFNHAIVAVPLEKDTIFLECTSPNTPLGYLGAFTGDRKALWIDGENSVLVNTKSYSSKDNMINNTIDININSEENIEINFKQSLSGIGMEHHGYIYTTLFTDEKFTEHLKQSLPEINNVEIINRSYLEDQFSFECKLASSKNVSKSGSRYFIKLRIDELPPSILDNSKFYSLKNGYTIMEKYDIKVPEGCHLEKAPKTRTIESNYVDIQMETTANQQQIIVQRNLHLKAVESSENNKAQIEEAIILLKKAINETVVINCKS